MRGVKITQEFVIHFTWSTNLQLFLSNIFQLLLLQFSPSPLFLSLYYDLWIMQFESEKSESTQLCLFELCNTIGLYSIILICRFVRLPSSISIIRDYIEKSYFWARCHQGIEKWELLWGIAFIMCRKLWCFRSPTWQLAR